LVSSKKKSKKHSFFSFKHAFYCSAKTKKKLKQYDEAMNLYVRAKRLIVEQCSSEHWLVGATFAGMGDIHRKRGELADALRVFERARAIIVRSVGARNTEVVDIDHSRARCLAAQPPRHAEAEALLLASVPVAIELVGERHERVLEMYESLAELYEKMQKSDKAEQYLQLANKKSNT
jgi:tetratricopeptide (TPR) repeat protein